MDNQCGCTTHIEATAVTTDSTGRVSFTTPPKVIPTTATVGTMDNEVQPTKVSTEVGNQLQNTNGGLYVPPPTPLTLVDPSGSEVWTNETN